MHDGLKIALAHIGWAMRPPGFIAFERSAAADEFERLYAQKATESGYENVAQLDANEIARLPAVSSIMDQVARHMHAISPALQFGQLWLVKSREENIHADAVPFVAHFDKQRFLKAMIYLDDVTASDGPFTVASQPPARTDARRRSLPEDYKARGLNVVRDLPASAFTACTGSASSVIFFDTNSPHYAGHVRGTGQRRVFRFDFYDPAWNQPPFAARVARKIRKLLGG
jgi:hypothetical protein